MDFNYIAASIEQLITEFREDKNKQYFLIPYHSPLIISLREQLTSYRKEHDLQPWLIDTL
jgi:hypothetical protein